MLPAMLVLLHIRRRNIKKKVDAEIKEKGFSTAEPLDYNYKEFLLDVAIFAVMLVVL